MTITTERPASHPSCYHVGYALSCAEFDGLRALAQGHCTICRNPAARLYIDHDHELGFWAVRGLVCPRCNQRLRHVDSGEKTASAAQAQYLADAWHLRQMNSATKRARMKYRVACVRCDMDFAAGSDGRPRRHWSRVPGENGQICGSLQVAAISIAPVFTAATLRLLESAHNVSRCLHHKARIHKGLCYACGTYVGTNGDRR